MKTKIISTILAAAMLITLSFTTIFAVETANAEEDTLQFEVLDENGNVEEILDFELVNTYYVDVANETARGIAPQALTVPDPSTDYYDLSSGDYVLYTEQSKSVYKMDKCFLANYEGCFYISAYVVDADAKLKVYKYKFDDITNVWFVREYVLTINPFNYRARIHNSIVPTDDETEYYYTYTVESMGGNFTTGILKASWDIIEDPYDIHP